MNKNGFLVIRNFPTSDWSPHVIRSVNVDTETEEPRIVLKDEKGKVAVISFDLAVAVSNKINSLT